MADSVSPSWTRYSTFTRLELIESCASNVLGVLSGRDSATGTDRSVRAAINGVVSRGTISFSPAVTPAVTFK